MEFLEHIKLILAQEDVEGLISMGAPYGEYDNEAQLIYNKMKGRIDLSLDQVSDIVADVFDSQFCIENISNKRITQPYHWELTKDLSKKIWISFLEHVGVRC